MVREMWRHSLSLLRLIPIFCAIAEVDIASGLSMPVLYSVGGSKVPVAVYTSMRMFLSCLS